MNIYELLKQLNKIEPDKNYSLISKNKILNNDDTAQNYAVSKNNKDSVIAIPRRRIFSRFTFSLIFSLAGFFIILGLVSVTKNIYPNVSALNPGAIKAEADAIDFQIELSRVIYNATESPDVLILNQDKKSVAENKSEDKEILNSSSSDTTSSASVEDVLDYLSK